jgi:hypothetical protein
VQLASMHGVSCVFSWASAQMHAKSVRKQVELLMALIRQETYPLSVINVHVLECQNCNPYRAAWKTVHGADKAYIDIGGRE